jgi:hypothetical protein
LKRLTILTRPTCHRGRWEIGAPRQVHLGRHVGEDVVAVVEEESGAGGAVVLELRLGGARDEEIAIAVGVEVEALDGVVVGEVQRRLVREAEDPVAGVDGERAGRVEEDLDPRAPGSR